MNIIEKLYSVNAGDVHWLATGLYGASGIIGIPAYLLLIRRVFKLCGWIPKGTFILHLFFLLANLGLILSTVVSTYSSFIGQWPFGEPLCQTFAYGCMSLGITALLLFACLAVDRYADDTDVKMYKKMNGFHFFLLAVFSIGCGFAWSSAPLYGYGKYGQEPDGRSCLFNWFKMDTDTQVYLFLTTVFSFLISFIIPYFCIYKSKVYQRKAHVGTNSRKAVLVKLVSRIFWLELIAWMPYIVTIIFGIFGAKTTIMNNDIRKLIQVYAFVPPVWTKLFIGFIPLIYSCTLSAAIKSHGSQEASPKNSKKYKKTR